MTSWRRGPARGWLANEEIPRAQNKDHHGCSAFMLQRKQTQQPPSSLSPRSRHEAAANKRHSSPVARYQSAAPLTTPKKWSTHLDHFLHSRFLFHSHRQVVRRMQTSCGLSAIPDKEIEGPGKSLPHYSLGNARVGHCRWLLSQCQLKRIASFAVLAPRCHSIERLVEFLLYLSRC